MNLQWNIQHYKKKNHFSFHVTKSSVAATLFAKQKLASNCFKSNDRKPVCNQNPQKLQPNELLTTAKIKLD